MPYLAVSDFKGGLDRRREQHQLPAGTLWQARNMHLTRGGEIEKRYAIVPVFNAAGTIGLASTLYDLYVFGSGARPATLDPLVKYQQLVTGGSPVVKIQDWETYGGKVYVVAELADGNIRHFYDGTMVADWTSPAPVPPPAFATGEDNRQSVLTLGQKMYAGAQPVLFFSAVGDPTKWSTGTGSGYVDTSNAFGGSENIKALGVYQGKLAVFSRKTIQIWAVDPDPAQNSLIQILPNIGALASGSVVNFGDSDLFFLSDSGVRSLRARDSSNNAATTDIGTPIDPLLALVVRDDVDLALRAKAVVDPRDGRYWLILDDLVYVFTYFPGSKISAWTNYVLPVVCTEVATLDGRVWMRGADDQLYLYGGLDGATYGDTYDVIAELPLLDADRPVTFKQFIGFDISCRGQWSVDFGTLPDNPAARSRVAIVDKPTYAMERIGMEGVGTHAGFLLSHRGPGRAAVAAMIVHFQSGETE